MSLEGENDFTGELRLPLPPTSEWEEWSWKFRAYLSMFDVQLARYLEEHDNDDAPLADEALQVHVLTDEGVAALELLIESLSVESCIFLTSESALSCGSLY